MMQEHLSTIKC